MKETHDIQEKRKNKHSKDKSDPTKQLFKRNDHQTKKNKILIQVVADN